MKTVQLTVKVLVLLATLMMAGPALAAPGVTLITSSTTVKVGDEFTVAVELTGLDLLEGVDLLLSYDQLILEALALQPGTILAGGTVLHNRIGNGSARLAIGLGNAVPVTGANTIIAVLTFKALEAGSATIQVDSLDVAVPAADGIPQLLSLGSVELSLVVQQAGSANNNSNENPGTIVDNVSPKSGDGNVPATGNPNSGSGSSNQGNSAAAPGNGNQPAVKEASKPPQGRSPVDIPPGHWARSSIQQLVDGGYASGYEDGSFKPEQEITRAEFLALVTRILGLEGASTAVDVNNNFSDGSAIPAWAQGVVASAYARGLVQGDEQGRFRPNEPISRAEIAAIVIRALGEEEQSKAGSSGQQAFTDSPQASWAAGYLGRGKQIGLMTGYEDGSFRPNNRSTRAEAAALVSRMLGRLQPSTGS